MLTVFPWAAEVLAEWAQLYSLLVRTDSPALWPSESTDRVSLCWINQRFAAYRSALGLSDGLDFHSLRRSYVTHLIEDGWDPLFVQQAGHEHASTTSLYTCVSSNFRTRTLRKALDATTEAALNHSGRSR